MINHCGVGLESRTSDLDKYRALNQTSAKTINPGSGQTGVFFWQRSDRNVFLTPQNNLETH